jgi:carboxylesterase
MSVIFSLGVNASGKTRHEAPAPDNGIFLKGDKGLSAILIHGLTGTPNEMKYLANFLNKKGYTVACPRLAKHGGPIDDLRKARWQEFYRSARSVLTEGELAGAKGPVFASGLSMGALFALLLADEFKERISAVSCLAPTLFYDGWNTPYSKYLLPLACTPLRHFFYFKEEPPYGIKNEAVRERVHRYYSNASLDDLENVAQYGYPYFPVALLYQLQLLVKYVSRRLPRIKQPVQLIQAKDDDMTSAKNSKYIYDRIGSDIKEIVLLYNSYHMVTADQERDTVAAKMDAFFNRINGGINI